MFQNIVKYKNKNKIFLTDDREDVYESQFHALLSFGIQFLLPKIKDKILVTNNIYNEQFQL